jgi:protein-serine/threonine kinase
MKTKTLNEEKKLNILSDEKIYSKLYHPNLVETVEFYKSKAQFVVLVEPYYKTSLADYVKNRQLSENDVLAIFKQVCKGLEYVHRKGILHGKVTLENTFLDGNKVKLGHYKNCELQKFKDEVEMELHM